jgi:hypothetical protein
MGSAREVMGATLPRLGVFFSTVNIICSEAAMSALTLKVNGRSHALDVDPSTPLLYVLSDDLELRGPKFGCGLGQ